MPQLLHLYYKRMNFSSIRLKALLLLPLALAVSPSWASRLAPLKDPKPLTVPAGLTTEQVRRAIAAGMMLHQWSVDSERPGDVIAVQSPRDVTLKVHIHFDLNTVAIAYLDSTNMEYRVVNGVRQIHQNYNRWTRTLDVDIENALNTEAAAITH